MRLAVIGATGMLGHHVVLAALGEGHDLRVVHRAGSKLDRIADLEFEAAVGDLDDPASLVEALSGADAVVHAAAYYPRDAAPWSTHRDRARKEMTGFLEACAKARVGRIVYVGGSIVLRRPADGSLGREDSDWGDGPPPQRNGYIQAKWIMDRLAREAAADGLPVMIGIPAMTFGEYDFGPTTGRIITEVANRTIPAYVDGSRNVIYAGDAGRGLLAVLARGRVGERYLLTGENTTMSRVVAAVARLAEIPPPRKVPLPVARWLARFQALRHKLGGRPPKLDDTALAVMAGGQHLSGAKARDELGFEAALGLEQILARTFEWFVKSGYIRR
ncbi:MAG: NAD-dependent epimerase/dehydratase family protein [Xanthomonadales bacterium]|nr:NAD-dependent epimerase/dehydratase family protein [Xanthomonadales bacterium]